MSKPGHQIQMPEPFTSAKLKFKVVKRLIIIMQSATAAGSVCDKKEKS